MSPKQRGSTASRAPDACEPLLWISDLLGWSPNHRGHFLVVELLRQLCRYRREHRWASRPGPPSLAEAWLVQGLRQEGTEPRFGALVARGSADSFAHTTSCNPQAMLCLSLTIL